MSGSPPLPPSSPLHARKQSTSQTPPHSAATPTTTTPGAAKRPRACESCRTSKLRCSFLTPEGENEATCRSCEKSGAACVVEPRAAKPATTAASASVPATQQGGGGGHATSLAKTDGSILGKRRRACEACRTSKAKCIFEAENDSTCKNCEKARRTCIVELDGRFPKKIGDGGHAGEKRRKVEKGDEKASAAAENGAQIASTTEKRSFGFVFPFLFSGDNNKDSVANVRSSGTASPSAPDVIERGLVTVSKAEECFAYFLTHQAPRIPWIGFPTPPSFSLCRSQSPFIFLAMIAAGAGHDPSDLQATLIDEFYKVMADLVIYRSQKRSDIAHAIIICTFWTPPPEHLEDLRYSTNVHLASSIIMDVIQGRLDTLLHPSRVEKARNTDDDAGRVESWRVVLSCFSGCSMLALTVKRPSVLRFSDSINRALLRLTAPDSSSSDVTKNDSIVVNWIRLHRIEEALAETKDSMSSENESANASDILTTRRLLAASFEGRLSEWRDRLSDAEAKSESLMIEYHFVQLQTSLLAMSHHTQQLGFPFTNEKLTTPMDVTNVGKSITESRAIINIFLGLSPTDLPSLPSIMFPRLIYSVITLAKVASTITNMYGKSGYDKMLSKDMEGLEVMEYCDRISNLLNRAAGPRPGRTVKIMGLLSLLKRWYIRTILGNEDAVPKHKSKKKVLPDPAKSQPSLEETFNELYPERGGCANELHDLITPTPFNTVNAISPSSGSNQSAPTPTAQHSKDPNRHITYSLPSATPAQIPTYGPAPNQQQQPQYSSAYQPEDPSVSAPNAYPETGIYSVTGLDPSNNKFMSANTGMYSAMNPDNYSLDPSAMGMDGIPPLDPFEESQYGFLDALLGPGSGSVPFGMVNDAMAGFGWM